MRLAIASRDTLIPTIEQVHASVELLIARPLQRSTKVDKRIPFYGERTVCVARVEDGRCGDVADCAGECLGVGLAWEDVCVRCGEKGGEDGEDGEGGGGELHGDGVEEDFFP